MLLTMRMVLLMQVAAAVYSCDTRKLFVTMKDGFPSEYVVGAMCQDYIKLFKVGLHYLKAFNNVVVMLMARWTFLSILICTKH